MKRLLLILLIGTLAVTAYTFCKSWSLPDFPDSPQYRDGKFRNVLPKPAMGLRAGVELWWTFLFNKPKGTVPTQPIPVQPLDRATLDADEALKVRLEAIRLQAGPKMNLGDVAEKSVPKMMLVAAPADGGAICVRSFIPHRCHASIGVLSAVTVATACLLPGSPAHALARLPGGQVQTLAVEHPSGDTTCVIELDEDGQVARAAMLRTARKLFDGALFD